MNFIWLSLKCVCVRVCVAINACYMLCLYVADVYEEEVTDRSKEKGSVPWPTYCG